MTNANAIMVIQPYRHAGTWVFDDPRVGLVQEPFVAGIPEMIEALVREYSIPNAEAGFRLLFATAPFPGYQVKLNWRRNEYEGCWYFAEKYNAEGWLCPALFRYFDAPPREIYVKAEPLA